MYASEATNLQPMSPSLAHPVEIRRLAQVVPLLPLQPAIVYEYTVPRLSPSAQAAMDRGLPAQPMTYRVNRMSSSSATPPEAAPAKAFEAVQLVSTVYAKILDPLRAPVPAAHRPDKAELFERFARTVATPKLLAALELIAANIDALRQIDRYQAGVGTNAVRWMQYLAGELLETRFVQEPPRYEGDDQGRVRRALHEINGSISVLDRFSALGRSVA
jgi:hypothetical protein